MVTDLQHEKRSSRETIRRIIVAARAEFGIRGLEGARIEDIAKRSGKTKQLIYHYYGSKEALYAEVVRTSHSEAVKDLLRENYDSLAPRDAFVALVTNVFEQYRRFPDWGPLMLDENVHGGVHLSKRDWLRNVTRPLIDQLASVLDRGAAQGEFKDVVDKERFYAAVLTLVTACFLTGNVTSLFLGIDMTSEEGTTRWRDYAIDLLLTMLRRTPEQTSF